MQTASDGSLSRNLFGHPVTKMEEIQLAEDVRVLGEYSLVLTHILTKASQGEYPYTQTLISEGETASVDRLRYHEHQKGQKPSHYGNSSLNGLFQNFFGDGAKAKQGRRWARINDKNAQIASGVQTMPTGPFHNYIWELDLGYCSTRDSKNNPIPVERLPQERLEKYASRAVVHCFTPQMLRGGLIVNQRKEESLYIVEVSPNRTDVLQYWRMGPNSEFPFGANQLSNKMNPVVSRSQGIFIFKPQVIEFINRGPNALVETGFGAEAADPYDNRNLR